MRLSFLILLCSSPHSNTSPEERARDRDSLKSTGGEAIERLEMDKYEPVREIGSGNFGVAKLMRNRDTRELVAMKFIERGYRV